MLCVHIIVFGCTRSFSCEDKRSHPPPLHGISTWLHLPKQCVKYQSQCVSVHTARVCYIKKCHRTFQKSDKKAWYQQCLIYTVDNNLYVLKGQFTQNIKSVQISSNPRATLLKEQYPYRGTRAGSWVWTSGFCCCWHLWCSTERRLWGWSCCCRTAWWEDAAEASYSAQTPPHGNDPYLKTVKFMCLHILCV